LGNILSGNSFTETATQSTNILVGSGGASPVTITVGSGNFSIGLTNVTQLLLNNDLQVTTSGALADVTFGSVIDSAASAVKGITINTTGDIIFGGNIGQATNARLGAISLTNNALSLTATNVNIKAGSFTTGASTAVKGPIDLSGTIDLDASAGLTLKTDTTSTTSSLGTLKLGPVTTTNGGNVVLTHSGLLTLLGDVIANGNITETATGSSTPGVEIGNTTISGTVTLNSNPTNGFISLSRPVTLNQSLAIQASGNGNIAISTVDANSAALSKDLTITILGATGVVTLNGSLGATGPLTKVQVDAGAAGSIGINGAVITTTGSGGQSFTALNTNYATALVLTAGSGPIAFVGGLNSSSNADLTLATIGALSFGGAVGASGALGNIDTTLASSGLTATTISAKSFDTNVALAGPIFITGAQTYTDATTGFLRLETTGTSNMAMTSVIATNGGINLKTAQGTISVGALTASDVAGGDISLTHGGNLTLNGNIIAGDTLVITSGLNTLISVGTIAGALIPAVILIDVNNSDVAFGTNVDLIQNLTIQNRNSKDVIFSGFLDSSNTTKNLSISTTGDVSFVKTVGQIAASRLGDIAISNGASSLTASADVNANSLNSGVVAGTELVSVAITSTSGVGYTASSSFAVTIGTAGQDGVVTTATGTATTNAAGAIISIVITSAGSGYVTGNTYTVVGGTGTITTAAIVTATANGAINFAGTQNYAGASGLTLATTGANGNITVNGVTTTLGAVNFTNSNTLSLLGNISSFGQIKQQAGTSPGTVAVTTGVTTNNTQLTFNSTNSGLDFATSILTNQDSQFSSSTNGLIDIRSAIFSAPSIPRKLTVSNVNGTINFGGDIGSAANDFSQVVISAGATGIVNLAGANVITTGSSGQSFTAGSTNYTSNLTLDAGSGSIGFVGGLNSSNSKNLNLTNTGTLSFNGAVGAVGALGDIRITGASNGLTATGIIAKSLETAAGFELIGSILITGTQTYSDNLKLETAGTNNISVGVVNTTTGDIVLLTNQGSLNVGALTASASTINLTHGGTLTFAGDIFAGTTLVVNSTNGSAIIVGTGLDIIMRALAGGISLTGPVTLVNNLNATAGAGAINFGSTINSNSLITPRNLTLSLTAANPVTFGGDIGQTFRLGDISITGAPAGIDATTKNISAKSFVASASSGAINLQGTLDFNGANSGNGFNVTTTGTATVGLGNITLGQLTTSGGAVLISNSQILQLLGNVLSAGSITESGAGSVVLGDAGATSPTITVSTTTAGSGIVFGKNITLNRDGVLTAAGAGNVTLSGTVDNASGTAQGLTLNSTSGVISLNGNIGQGSNGGLASVNAATTGNITLGGSAITTQGNGGQRYSGANTSFTNNLVLSGGTGNIGFVGTLTSGVKNLTLTTTGGLSFGGAVSGLGNISVTAASAGLSGTTISATSLVGSVALTGPVSISGLQSYTNNLVLETSGTNGISVAGVNTTSQGISLKTAQGVLNVGALNAANLTNGNIALEHGGTLTFAGNVFAGKDLAVTTNNGATIIVGTGTDLSMQSLGSGITLGGAGGAISLVNNLIATAGAGAIVFNSTIDSATGKNLTLAMTLANVVTFNGTIGQINRLGDITITGAPSGISAGLNNISAKSLVAAPSSGAINLSGVLDFDGANGFNVTTTGTTGTLGNITLGQLTTSAGAVLISNSQILQLLGNVLSSGSITESGAGSVVLGDAGATSPTITVSTTTAGSGIVFGNNITLNRDGVLTAAGAGNVTLSGTVDNATGTAQGLTLNSTSGVISLNGNVGQGVNGGLASVNAATTGNISLGGTNVTTVGNGGQRYSGANTSFTNNLVLSGGTGAIGFVGTLTSGVKNLTLTTTGGLSFGGAVSGLGNISVTAASAGLSGTTISATSLVGSVALTGPVSISGLQSYTNNLVLETSGTNGISVAGVNTTSQGISLKTAQGVLNVGALNAANLTNGNIALEHGGTLTFAGNVFAGKDLAVTTNNGATIIVGTGTDLSMQSLGSGITLGGAGGAISLVNNLIATAGAGAIVFNSTIDSATGKNLTLALTLANVVTFNGTIGQINRLGDISITGAPAGISAGLNNISAKSLVAAPSSGAINLSGVLDFNGANGFNVTTTNTATAGVGNITLGQLTTSAGAVLISNSQILQLLGNVLSSGSITESGAGTVLLGDAGATSPTITVSTTTAGSGIVFGKNITLNRDGVLTAAGAGNVTLSGTVDNASATARGLALNSTSGVISLNGNIGQGVNGGLASVNAATTGNISLGATNVTTVGNGGQRYSGANTSFTNDLVLSGGTGSIGFVGTLTSGVKNLTLTTTGGLSFGGAVSGLGNISVTAASAGLTGTTISATSLVGSVALTGNVSISGQQNYTDRLVLATSGVNNIGVAGVNTTTGQITLTTNLGTLNVGSLIATANAVSLTHGGTLTIGGNIFAGTTLGVTTNNGATIIVGTGSNVSMQALTGGISLGGSVTLVNDLAVSASGAVAFGNTLNSTVGQRRALAISTINNSVTFLGAVGQVNKLGAISIAGTPTGIDAGTKNISAASFVNTGAVSGTINIQGTQNYDGAVGLNLLTTGAGGNITLGQVTTTAGGVTLTNSNLLTLLGNVFSFGTFLQQAGTGGTPTLDIGVTSNGTVLNIQTTNAGSAIDIGSATKLNQSTGLIAAGNGSVDLRSTVNSNTTTSRSLNISNTGGTITMGGAIGTSSSVPSSALSLIVLNAGSAGTINLNGGAITTSTSTGQIYTGAINLGNANLSLTANGTGVLTFNGNINGTQNLTMKTAGAINFNGNIGATNPLGDMFIDAANPSGFTITGTVNASSLQNINNSFVNGNISIVSAQNYSVGGLVLESRNAGSITVGNIISGGSSSTVSFTHQGNLNLQGNINNSGTFAQIGTSGGTVLVGTTVPTTIQIGLGGAAFNRAVTLNRSLSLTAPGDISFAQNLNSAVGQTSNLTLNSAGILSFANNVGNTTALGVIDASTATLTGITANNVNSVIKAQSFNSGFVAGDINLTTPQTYSTVTGLNLTTVVPISGTSNITLGAVTTSNGGVVNIQNVDGLKLQGTLTLDGAFTQTNNDLTSLNEFVEFGAAIGISFNLTTTGDNISFEAPITMFQNSSLSTGATGLGIVTLSSSVDSLLNAAKNLSVTNVNGITNIGGSLGTVAATAELGFLAITSNAINFTDNLNTTNVKTKGASGQSYTGTVSLNGDVLMDAGTTGPVSFSSTIDSAALATKALTLQGVNAVQLNGNIGATNPLSSFSVSGTSSALTTFNAGSVTTIGSGQTYNTALLIGNTAPGQINLTAGSGDVVFGNTVGLTSKNLTVSADEIEINSTIDPSSSGVSVLILKAGNTSTPVVIGGTVAAGTLDLTSAELLNLVNGFRSITIGDANSLGNLTVATALTSSEIRDPFTLTTSGNMFINGAIAAVDNATLSLVDPNYATATITLASAISTQGNVITIDGATQVNTGGAIATTGTGNSNPTGANIDLKVNSRFTGAGNLTLDSGSVGLIGGNNSFNMSGGITITNSGGTTFSQGVTAGAVNINATTSGKDVAFNGPLNAVSLNTSTGAYNLKVLSGGTITGATVLSNTGTTTLGDQTTDALTFAGGLIATSSSKLNLAGTIATTGTAMTLGNSDLSTSTTLQSGIGTITTGSVTGGTGTKLSLQNNIATGAVNLTGNVTVNQLETFAGGYAVNLTGSNNLISGASTTFLNSGVTFGDSTTDISTFTNGLTATASTVNLAGIVATTNSAMNLGAVNLSQNGTVKSGSGIITIASVNGASRKLSLQDNTANSRGLVVVNGAVNIGQIETFAQNYAVSLLGSNIAVSSASTFNNTGTTTFGDGGTGVDTLTFTGGLVAKAGSIILNSTLATVNNLLDIGTVTLAGNSTLQSGTGTITVGSITDGSNSYSLALQNGAAAQGSVIFSGDVTISALSTAAGIYAVSFQNNTTVDTATTFTNLAGVSFGRNASSLTTFTNGVTATAGTGNFVLAGTLKTAGQPINIGNSGVSINLVDSTIIDSGNSSSATISINSPISTNGRSLTLSSGSTTGGTISVNSIDSTAGGLTIANAGGQVTFTGNVGAATGSGLITITNSQQGVEFQGQLFGSNVNIVNTAASKTIKFGGNLTLTGSILTTQQNYNIDISGATNVIGAANNFNNLGNVNINSASGSTTFNNGFGASFPAAINIQGTIVANGQVNISKPVNVNGATTTTFNSTSNTISGVVTGSAAITSNGIGTLSLTGNSTGYTGTINANAGNVAVNANFANASAVVGAAGKISGIGSIGALTANGGVVSPGNSPGTLTVGTATLGTTGSQATYNVEINGASAGQFDQIKVNSSATLANAVLNITAGGNLQVGQQFQIVSGTVTGTFANAVSSIVAGNTTFSVTYNANGVLLTVTSVTPSPTPTPTPTPSPTPTPTPTPSPTPAPTPTPPAPSPTPTPTPTGPYALFAVGADAGGGPEVKVNFTDGSSVSFFAYDMAYRGGVRVTMGDLNGDGTNEVITGTGPGGGPNIRVFNVTSSGNVTMVANFFAFEPQFMGGVYVAAGNLNGDVSGSGNGIADLIVSAGPGGGPRVIAYSGGANYVNLNNQLCDYFVYSPAFTGGVSVAAGNVVGAANSADELITGAGPGGGPHVRAFQLSNTNTPNSVIEYMAFDPAIRNGIYVGAGDLDADGYDEIFTGTNSAPTLPTMVNVRYGNGNQAVVYPFGEFTGGARVGVAKDNNNNQYMVVGAGPGGGPLVQIYNRNLIAVDSLFAFPLNFTGGVFTNTSIS
jgi:hypothetical protein